MANKRKRSVFSVKHELLKKSKESALSAVQIFNNPTLTFKSETFILLMDIAWTSLMFAYCREQKIECRYVKKHGKKRRIFAKTKQGSYKYWELERCLNTPQCPLSKPIISNLKFLIGIRHEIAHQMTSRIDDYISAKLQACCLNYNSTIKELFAQDISDFQPVSLQFFAFGEEQIDSLKDKPDIPKNIIDFISSYENNLEESERLSSQYSYRVIYTRINVNHENQADRAYRFIRETSYEGEQIHNVLIRNKQYTKLTQKEVVKRIKEEGYASFSPRQHRQFWQSKWKTAEERNKKATEYGELVLKNQWLWYKEKWLSEVRNYCKENLKEFENN